MDVTNTTAAAGQEEISSFMSDLLETIDSQEISELKIETDDNFAVKDEEQAEYLLKSLRKITGEIEEIENTAEAYKKKAEEKAEAWKASRTRSLNWSRDWIEARLRLYAERCLLASKKKSLKLIEGTMSFRKNESFDYDDDDLRQSLQALGGKYLISQPAKIDKAALKKAVTYNEEGNAVLENITLKGLRRTVQDDAFKVSFG